VRERQEGEGAIEGKTTEKDEKGGEGGGKKKSALGRNERADLEKIVQLRGLGGGRENHKKEFSEERQNIKSGILGGPLIQRGKRE